MWSRYLRSVMYLENNVEPGSVVYVAANHNHQMWLYEKNLSYFILEVTIVRLIISTISSSNLLPRIMVLSR